jgi:hypothetical protein
LGAFVSTALIVAAGLAVAAFLYWNSRPVQRTPNEVAELLRARVDGSFDGGEWDYFISCRIADQRLEKLRQKILEVEVIGSEYLDDKDGNLLALSSKGVRYYESILQECKALS